MNAASVLTQIMAREEHGELDAPQCANFMRCILAQLVPRFPAITPRALELGDRYWSGEAREDAIASTRGEIAGRRDNAPAALDAALGALMCYLSPRTLTSEFAGETLVYFVNWIEMVSPGFDYSAAWLSAFGEHVYARSGDI